MRGATRESVVILGACRIGERPSEDVLITDLSANGCRLRGNSVGVTKAEAVELMVGEHGPIPAKLKWLKKGSLGLAFESPLDEGVLQRLLDAPAAPAPSNVVPLRRRSAG
jgi:hypothetical protein